MKKLVSLLMLISCAVWIVGCGEGDIGETSKNDPTPAGEADIIDDTSADAIQGMEHDAPPGN